MKNDQNDFIHKIHLIVSVIIVIPTAIVYGFFPGFQFELFPKTIDEHNFYKAIMGLYLGFSSLWLLGIIKQNFLKIALVTNMIFMLGLSFGRIVSILIDGLPALGYVFGTLGELLIGFYGLWVMKRLNTSIQLKKQ